MTNPGKKHISEEQLLANPHDGGLAPSKFPIKVQKAGIVVFVLAVVAAEPHSHLVRHCCIFRYCV